MTDPSPQMRKPSDRPYDATPYATLRSAAPAERTGEGAASDFAAEGEKLRALREALWAAFEAGPSAGLPNTLIDLTMAYTGALRLQLNLRSVASRQVKPQARPVPVPRGEAAVKS